MSNSVDEKALREAWGEVFPAMRPTLRKIIERYEAAKAPAKDQPVDHTGFIVAQTAYQQVDGDVNPKALKSALSAYKEYARPKRESRVGTPSEAMCDRARGFIMGLDLGVRSWLAMKEHLDYGGYPSIPRIDTQAEINPRGHITKWDVAECIYVLMTTETDDHGRRELDD
jgi:hypothetical protein